MRLRPLGGPSVRESTLSLSKGCLRQAQTDSALTPPRPPRIHRPRSNTTTGELGPAPATPPLAASRCHRPRFGVPPPTTGASDLSGLGDRPHRRSRRTDRRVVRCAPRDSCDPRSEEHTSELQSRSDLVCRLLLEKKKKK